MKMQVGVRERLERVLYNIERAESYLKNPKVVGIAHRTERPDGMSYTVRNKDCLKTVPSYYPEHVSVVNKEAGSHITGIYDAKRQLEGLLEESK